MIDRKHIETLLHIHGIAPTAPDEEIRSILLSSHYNDDEINTAITVLRANKIDNTAHLDGLHKIYRTDSGLKPAEISALLGIDISVSELEIKNHRTRSVTKPQYFVVLGITLLLAFCGLIASMHATQTGPFHPSSALFSK